MSENLVKPGADEVCPSAPGDPLFFVSGFPFDGGNG